MYSDTRSTNDCVEIIEKLRYFPAIAIHRKNLRDKW